MPGVTRRGRLRARLEQSAQPLAAIEGIPSSFAMIEHASFSVELQDELARLRFLINSETVPENELAAKFKQFCKERDARNRETSLSFAAAPDGVCNQLYWDLACILFEPTNLAEMAAILFPSVEFVLQLEVIRLAPDERQSTSLEDTVQFKFKRYNVANALAGYRCDRVLLQRVIYHKDMVFPVAQVAHLDYPLHRKFHQCVSQEPVFMAKLYAHNPDFEQLKVDIEGFESPYEAMSQLIFHLDRSGQSYTEHEFATNNANAAVKRFVRYCNSLPSDKKLWLLGLSNSAGKTVESVLDDLGHGKCVETAASNLSSIRGRNDQTLRLPINLTPDDRKAVAAKYRRASRDAGLALAGKHTAARIPTVYKQRVLRTIQIETLDDLIDLLLHFPAAEYEGLLDSVFLDSGLFDDGLAGALRSLDSQKYHAFMQAFLKRYQYSISYPELLSFASVLRDDDYTVAIVQMCPQHNRLNMFMYSHGNSLFYGALRRGDLEQFLKLLALLPEDQRLEALTHNETMPYCETLARFVSDATNAEMKTLFELIPKHQYFSLLSVYVADNLTFAYDLASHYTKVLPPLLQAIPRFQRLALMLPSTRGFSLLHHLAEVRQLTEMQAVLSCFPIDDQRTLLKRQATNGWTVLDYACKNENPAMLMMLLRNYPQAERSSVLQSRNGKDISLAARATIADDSEVFESIYKLLPEDQCLRILREKVIHEGGSQKKINVSTFLRRYHADSPLKAIFLQLLQAHVLRQLFARNKGGSDMSQVPAATLLAQVQRASVVGSAGYNAETAKMWDCVQRRVSKFDTLPKTAVQQALKAYEPAAVHGAKRREVAKAKPKSKPSDSGVFAPQKAPERIVKRQDTRASYNLRPRK